MSKHISFTRILDPLGLFTKPKSPKSPDAPRTPGEADPAVEEARRKEVIAANKAKGSAGTYTGSGGDSTPPQLGTKRLLGS